MTKVVNPEAWTLSSVAVLTESETGRVQWASEKISTRNRHVEISVDKMSVY